MIHGEWVSGVITAGATLSAEADLGRVYEQVMIYVPTLGTCQVSFQISRVSGSGFANLFVTDPADGSNNLIITDLTAGDFYWIAPIGGFRYIKAQVSAAQSADVTFIFQGVRS